MVHVAQSPQDTITTQFNEIYIFNLFLYEQFDYYPPVHANTFHLLPGDLQTKKMYALLYFLMLAAYSDLLNIIFPNTGLPHEKQNYEDLHYETSSHLLFLSLYILLGNLFFNTLKFCFPQNEICLTKFYMFTHTELNWKGVIHTGIQKVST
jgi:hypothetical protein